MNKRVKSLIMCLASVVGVGAMATACGQIEDTHVHTYSDAWTKDASGHWNEATCECEDVEAVKKAHVDANNDGACDICTYTDHTHTYSEDWTVDCTNHWHAADCGHIVAGDAVEAHVDENEDGECDVCKYVIEDIHQHYFASELSSDEEYHWYAALCEHKDQVSGKAAHNLNNAGDCTDCGKHVVDVDVTNLQAVLDAAVANNYKVAYGDVVAKTEVWDGVGKETLMNGATDRVHFALGNGESYLQFTHFDMNGEFSDQKEQWFERLEDESIFGAELTYGQYELAPIAGEEQFLNGYNYLPGSVIASASDDTSTLANMLTALYNQMKAGVNVSNATENYDAETGKYTFSYTYYSENSVMVGGKFFNLEVELYNVDVAFTINDEMIIDKADFSVEVYRDYENDSDLDYEYEVVNEVGTVTGEITLKNTANPSYYIYNVAQSAGDRTFTTPYPRYSLIPTSFNFYYVTDHEFPEAYQWVVHEEEIVEDTLTIQEGTYAYFRIGDILPVTASSKFINTEDFTFTFVNNDPTSDAKAWYMTPGSVDATVNGYSAYIGCLKLKLRDPGSYTVTIGFGNLTKEITLVITGEPEPELGEDSATLVNVATTDTYAWDVDLYSYTAAEEGTYTFNLPAGLGFQKKGSNNPQVDFYDNTNGATVEVPLEAGQTLEFYVAAISKATWAITVDFVAGEVEGEVGGGDDVGGDDTTNAFGDIVGTYYSGSNVLVINEDGTMTWTCDGVTYNYTYTIEGNTISYSLNGNAPYTSDGMMAQYFGYIKFGADGKPESFVHSAATYVLSTENNAGGGDEGGDDVGGGEVVTPEAIELEMGVNTITVTDADLEEGAINATLEVVEAGTYTFASNNLLARIYDADDNMIGNGSAYLEAGSYKVAIITAYLSAAGEYDLTVEYTAPEGGDDIGGGDVEVDPDEPAGWLYAGEDNEVEITDEMLEAGYVIYAFMPWENGDYMFTSGSLLATLMDAEGNDITPVSYGVYSLEAWNTYYVKMSTNWVSEAGMYDMYIEYQAPAGHYENPIYLVLDTEYTVNYKGDYNFTNYVYYASENGTLTITSTNANAIIGLAMKGADEVQSIDGVVSLDVIAGCEYRISVGGEDVAADIVFTAAFVAGEVTLDGSSNLPFALQVGANTATYADWATVNYLYTATEDGVLTLTAGENTNMWVKAPEYLEPDDGVITIEVYAGDSVVVCAETADWSEGEVSVTVALKAAPSASMVELVADGTANALEIADNTYLTADVYGLSGDYVVTWDNENLVVYVDGVEIENGGTFNSMMPYWGVYFMIYADGYVAATANLTITAVVVPATEFALGDNTVASNGNSGVNAEFTAVEAGDYAITGGTNAVINYQGMYYMAGQSITVSLEAGAKAEFTVYTEDYTESDVVVTIAKAESEDEGTELAGSGTSADPYVIAELPYTITEEGAHDYYVVYTATEAGTLKISYVNGAYVSDLPEGWVKDAANLCYTVPVTAGQAVKMNLWSTRSAGTFVYAFEFVANADDGGETPDDGGETPDVGGDDNQGGENPVLQGSGTMGDRWVLVTLPYQVTFESTHDVYYTYTATEDCTLKFTCPAGCLISELGASKDEEGNYNVSVTAGQTIKFNPWSNGGTAPYTYTISALVVEEPDDNEGEGEGEGTDTPVAGESVVYLSETHASGRKLQVTINAAAGTISVIRSTLSGVLDTAFGATEATGTYSYDGSTVTCAISSCTITWNADGTPASITWGSATFTNFAVQA